jgi:hypothetical protein
MVKRLLKCVSEGLTLKQSAIACGIGESTLLSWKHVHPELVPQLEEAREQARQKALATIWEARGEDWRAAESFLKYSFWQDYRQGGNISVQATAVSAPPMISEETRARLQSQRQELLRSTEAPQALSDKVIEAEVLPDSRAVETEPKPKPEQAPVSEAEDGGSGFDARELIAKAEEAKKRPKSQVDTFRELFGHSREDEGEAEAGAATDTRET